MHKSFLTAVLFTVLLTVSVSAEYETFGHMVQYQGILTNSVGELVPDGSYAITFRIFDALTGGNELWSEAHPAVTSSAGQIAVALGSINPISMDSLTRMAAYTSANLYLDIQIGADAPISPRTRLGGSLYSAVSMRLHGDIETGSGVVTMLDSLGDTVITWDAQAAKGVLKVIPPDPGGTTHQTEIGAGDLTLSAIGPTGEYSVAIGVDDVGAYITMLDSLGDTTILWDAQAAKGVIKSINPTGTTQQTEIGAGDLIMSAIGPSGDTSEFSVVVDSAGIIIGLSAGDPVEGVNVSIEQDPGGMKNAFTATSIGPAGDTSMFSMVVDSSGVLLKKKSTGGGFVIEVLDETTLGYHKALCTGQGGGGIVSSLSELTIDSSGVQQKKESTGSSGNVVASLDKATPGFFKSLRTYGDGIDSSFSELTVDSSGVLLKKESTGGGGIVTKMYDKASPKLAKALCSYDDGTNTTVVKRQADSSGGDLTISAIGPSGVDGVAIGIRDEGAYITMLDSLGDTTILWDAQAAKGIIKNRPPDPGGTTHQTEIGAGDLILSQSGGGMPMSQVTIRDLDADGDMDMAVDGNVGIGVAIPGNILEVAQSSATDPIADAWTTYSSRRWKKNITPIEGALGKVEKLRGVTYDWKADGKHDIGLIAEEVGEIFPEIVAYEANGVDARSVDYARLVAVLIEAVKELKVENDQLKSDLAQSETTSNDRMNKLQTQVTELSILLKQLLTFKNDPIPSGEKSITSNQLGSLPKE